MRAAFTDTLRHVIDRAQEEARNLNQEFVGTEHLMLAALHCDDCEAARLIRQSNLAGAEIRSALIAQLPKGKDAPVISGDLPLSPKAQRVINSTIVQAQSLSERTISTRVLLLALLDEPQTILAEALRQCGADTDALRSRLAAQPENKEI